MTDINWTGPPERFALSTDEIHLIRFALESGRDDSPADMFWGLLDPEEHRRARRFVRPSLTARFVMGRAILRLILARYTSVQGVDIEFAYGANGKPMLSGANASLCFNLSHTQSHAVCALAIGRPVGVDIEFQRPRDLADAIARRYFSPGEVAQIEDGPAADRVARFYQFWTAKEALYKGAGAGLTIPLDRCRFTLGTFPLALELGSLPELAAQSWCVYPFDPGFGCSGAVAVAGGARRILAYDWPMVGME